MVNTDTTSRAGGRIGFGARCVWRTGIGRVDPTLPNVFTYNITVVGEGRSTLSDTIYISILEGWSAPLWDDPARELMGGSRTMSLDMRR